MDLRSIVALPLEEKVGMAVNAVQLEVGDVVMTSHLLHAGPAVISPLYVEAKLYVKVSWVDDPKEYSGAHGVRDVDRLDEVIGLAMLRAVRQTGIQTRLLFLPDETIEQLSFRKRLEHTVRLNCWLENHELPDDWPETSPKDLSDLFTKLDGGRYGEQALG